MSLHIEHIVPIYIANWQSPIEDVFDMSWKDGPIPLEIKPSLLAWIEHRAGQYLRLSILNRIKGFNLKVIGETYWAELMGHEYYGGEIVYTKDNLARLYANTPIIINISRPQLKTTLNQRVYDVPASEGFLLTDKRQRLYQVFEERDMASYDYSSDIASLLRYYLERPELRREMAQSARKKILDGHTYVHRAKKIINTVLSVTS
ncbi:MAG TPA: glycosyltransferase family 1 protein [Deltaproteobacteria bacterium]|nr:glycosyltransferase family 1 protein [Deltaproteobacteria bacterium]